MLAPGCWCQDVSASDITGQGLGRSPTPLANSFKSEPVTSAVTSHPPSNGHERSRLTQTHRHLVTSR
ncbi:MAG: hypothetical protein AAGA75_21560 [Cyanobacteria bacterium P01_E01_bin.6]